MELSKYFSKDWYTRLKSYLESDHFTQIGWRIANERETKTIFPEKGSELLFKVFRETPFSKVKVVIMGQDPYHDGSFDGLSFSNRDDKITPSPSLRNILKEVERDVYNKFNINQSFSLYRWATQGVLLINTAHTVVRSYPGSHLKYWEKFTSKVIDSLNSKSNIIWLLWGNNAHKYEQYINNNTHIIIKSGHPSPLNTTHPFVGSGCFSKCNKELIKKDLVPIKW